MTDELEAHSQLPALLEEAHIIIPPVKKIEYTDTIETHAADDATQLHVLMQGHMALIEKATTFNRLLGAMGSTMKLLELRRKLLKPNSLTQQKIPYVLEDD